MSVEEILIVDYYKGVIKKQIDETVNKNLPAKKTIKRDRRNSNERRLLHKRRELIDRRIHKKHFYNHNDKNVKAEKLHLKKPRSLTYKNSLLQLNGIKEAMTFVQSGNHVTFLYCTLKILRVSN